MKAIKITTVDTKRVVNIKDLKGMQKHVGGNIQVIRSYFLNDLVVPANQSLLMIINDDGKNLGLEFNDFATCLYDNPYDEIVGDVLIMAEGFVDGEPDIVGLEENQVQALKKYF